MPHKKDTECPKQVKIREEFKSNPWTQTFIYFQKHALTDSKSVALSHF